MSELNASGQRSPVQAVLEQIMPPPVPPSTPSLFQRHLGVATLPANTPLKQRRRNTAPSRHLSPYRIGFITPRVHCSYLSTLLEGVSEALAGYGAQLVLGLTYDQLAREDALLQEFTTGATDGCILVHPLLSGSEFLQLYQLEYPFVVLDPRFPLQENFPIVSVENQFGARAAVEYLLTLGHQDIAVVTGPAEHCATLERLAGYHQALAAVDLTAQESLVQEGDWTIEGGRQAARRLLGQAKPPTAIFAFNDDMALGVLKAAHECGLKVPLDLSVVGFDDTDILPPLFPGLTTVHQPLKAMGNAAAAMLMRLLHGHTLDVSNMRLQTRLIIRSSATACRCRV